MKTIDAQSEVRGNRSPRIDGPLKVSGEALYSSDHFAPHLTFGVPVGATIANGKIKSLNLEAAKKIPGVLKVYSHGTLPGMYRHGADEKMVSHTDEQRAPFEDETIRYYGQYIALVVGETLETAEAGARAIEAVYESAKPNVDPRLEQETLKKTESERGDAKAAFAKAEIKIDQTYVTPVEVHNPIEMHASVAVWGDDGRLEVYETTQAIMNHQAVLAQMLGVPHEKVRVISRFLGSGFGGKLWPWPQSVLAAAAARDLARPVKIVVSRSQMFTNVGHRPRTQQRVQLGAEKNGKLVALSHDYASQGSLLDDFKEHCGEATPYLYSVKNLKVTSGLARRHQGAPTSMRGPGAVPGLYALESAMDELANALKMDPVQLRLLNEPKLDESTGQKFSSRHLKECFETGAKKFGWSKRKADVGSMKHGEEILGWGTAACSWGARRLSCHAAVELRRDGKARVSTATQDLGTGTYTVLAKILEDRFGLEPDDIIVSLGDSELTPGPISGGSMATSSLIPAVLSACDNAEKNLFKIASENGLVTSPKGKIPFKEILVKANVSQAWGKGESDSSSSEKKPLSFHSYGAHFVEIGWNPLIARLRVHRVVSVIDGGRILNEVAGKNQIEGAVVMGLGMGLFEESIYDARFGQPVNSNLADYLVPTHADCPEIDVTFLDHPDKELNAYGARGIGEIGLAGVAAALTAAVYHATGVRVRELPIKIEDLLKSALS